MRAARESMSTPSIVASRPVEIVVTRCTPSERPVANVLTTGRTRSLSWVRSRGTTIESNMPPVPISVSGRRRDRPALHLGGELVFASDQRIHGVRDASQDAQRHQLQ